MMLFRVTTPWLCAGFELDPETGQIGRCAPILRKPAAFGLELFLRWIYRWGNELVDEY